MNTFTIGNYKVYKKRIGKGAFSTVYKGFHIETKNLYAIKELNLDSLSKIKESIKRETNLMRKLKHKNIINLHDVIYDKTYNNIYLILDYCKRGDLTGFLDNKPLKEIYAKKYLRQLKDGLKYLLENNIMHRDLKPQNILITDNYDLVITDFGFARYIDINNDVMIQTLCGTPMYMAPEIMKYKKYDIKSDLWSVGVILYQMLFASPPFSAKNFIDLVKNIETKDIVIPDNYNISPECKDLLFGLLKKDPKERISWDNLFNHDWFKRDELLENENKLFDISMNKSLPDLNSFELNKNQFCSFKHKSIIESNNESIDSKTSNLSIQFPLEENESSEMAKIKKLNKEINTVINNIDLSYDSQNESDLSDNSESDNSESDNELFLSVNNSNIQTNKIKPEKSNPININYPEDYDDNLEIKNNVNKSSFFLSKSDYVMVKQKDYYSMSDPTNNQIQTTNSFKDILYSSIYFLKQSYNYISNNARSF